MSAAVPVRTHLGIDRRLVGEPLTVEEGRAQVVLTTLPEMAADDSGLVHGGFVFGLADYAAMLAVNHPNVVLAGAEVRFLKPVVVGMRLVATARRTESAGRKRRVEVEVRRASGVVVGDEGEPIFTGTFQCAVPDRHVLAPPISGATPAGGSAGPGSGRSGEASPDTALKGGQGGHAGSSSRSAGPAGEGRS